MPISYELSAANVADVGLVKELLAEANLGAQEEVARGLLGDFLAYRSQELEEELAEVGIVLWLATRPARDARGSGSR